MNVADIISRQAAIRPGSPAIVDPARTVDYLGLERAIWRAAAALRARGIGAGDVVGLSMGHHPLHLVASYALARLGAVQVALPLHDSEARRRELARRFGAGMTLGDTDASEEWLESGSDAAAPFEAAAGGDAGWKVVLSSGTTGEPKAVLRSHAMAIEGCRIQVEATALSPEDRYLAIIELSFFGGLARCMDTQLAGGAVVFRGGPTPDPKEQMARLGITFLALAPVQLRRMLASVPEGGARLPGLRLLRLDAMALPADLRRELAQRVTPNLFHSYGTNESGLLAFGRGEALLRHPEAVGHAAPRVALEVVDEAGMPVPPGETGVVRVRSPAMANGYIDDLEASARAFRDGWYYPGDYGVLDADGMFSVKGRADDMMNMDGIKIFPAEIERVLLEHPQVAEAAAFALPSDAHQDLPVAAVVLRQEVPFEELKRWCDERLGARAPRSLAALDAFPRNAMGKVLKRELRGLFARKQARKPG